MGVQAYMKLLLTSWFANFRNVNFCFLLIGLCHLFQYSFSLVLCGLEHFEFKIGWQLGANSTYIVAEIIAMASKCLAAVEAHDRAIEDDESLSVAQLKFDDILNSPSLEAAANKIDDLAKNRQLDSTLMLLITKAWAAAKESTMMKDEVGCGFTLCIFEVCFSPPYYLRLLDVW